MTHIILEGPDGVGKTTMGREVVRRLGDGWIFTCEPYDRNYRGWTQADFARDRERHFAEVIAPALAAGKNIVQDRGPLSALAYNEPDATPERVDAWMAEQPYRDSATFVLARYYTKPDATDEFEEPARLAAARRFYTERQRYATVVWLGGSPDRDAEKLVRYIQAVHHREGVTR